MIAMHSRFRLSTSSLLGILAIAGFSIYLSFDPLWHTDVWAHAKYGEWYWSHRATPAVEPLSPFSDKEVPFANLAWLSQVIYYLLYKFGATLAGGDVEAQLRGGAEALRSFHLLLLAGRFVLLWFALRRFGGSNNWATLGVTLYFFAVGIGSAVQRPQSFGLFFFTAIIFALSTPTLSRRAMIWLPAMFLLWANVHGTFMAGLLLLGMHTIGRAIEWQWNRPSVGANGGKEVRRLAIVCVLCGLATFVNPHGPFLIERLFEFSAQPNLKSMTEWYPMNFTLHSGAHWPYLMSLILLAFVRILGGRKVGIAGWLVALPLALWPWLQARMLLWWWTVAVWLLARLGPGLAARFPTMPAIPDGPPTQAKAWSAVAAITFAVLLFPPIRSLFPGVPRDAAHTVSAATPWRLAFELTAKPSDEGRWLPNLRTALTNYYPSGQFTGSIFASETQGDFLIWALPPNIPPMMYTHAHVFPPDYWEACRDVKAGNPGWREFLAKHRANLIVVETDSHKELSTEVRSDPAWIVIQDGPQGPPASTVNVLIALRKQPRITRINTDKKTTMD